MVMKYEILIERLKVLALQKWRRCEVGNQEVKVGQCIDDLQATSSRHRRIHVGIPRTNTLHSTVLIGVR
jgi:hypothetical protein